MFVNRMSYQDNKHDVITMLQKPTFKVMLHETIFNDDFERKIVALKSLSCNMAHRTIFFNATFRCDNMHVETFMTLML